MHRTLDGWSAGLVIKEVFDTYNALHRGQVLPMPRNRPYGDYIAWLQKQDLSVAKEFWKQRLKGFTTPTPLRVDRNFSGTSSQEENQDEQQILLPEATTAALQSLA